MGNNQSNYEGSSNFLGCGACTDNQEDPSRIKTINVRNIGKLRTDFESLKESN